MLIQCQKQARQALHSQLSIVSHRSRRVNYQGQIGGRPKKAQQLIQRTQ